MMKKDIKNTVTIMTQKEFNDKYPSKYIGDVYIDREYRVIEGPIESCYGDRMVADTGRYQLGSFLLQGNLPIGRRDAAESLIRDLQKAIKYIEEQSINNT